MTNSVTKKCVAAREENFQAISFRELKVTERQSAEYDSEVALCMCFGDQN